MKKSAKIIILHFSAAEKDRNLKKKFFQIRYYIIVLQGTMLSTFPKMLYLDIPMRRGEEK